MPDPPLESSAPARGVLVVEDDPRIAAMLVKGLHAKGFSADFVTTGAEALVRIERGGLDVLLLDLGLPDMDGLDILRALDAGGSTLPVIVLTARSDPRDRRAAIELGARDYLTKPFSWSSLWESVEVCAGANQAS